MQNESILLHFEYYGWSESFERQRREREHEFSQIGRIIGVERDWFRLVSIDEGWSQVSGRFRHRLLNGKQGTPPTVGDWVVVERDSYGSCLIEDVLSRRSALERKSPTDSLRTQVIASNIDRALMAMSVNADFSLNRAERFVAAVWDAGAEPAIVLVKIDLVENLSALLDEVEIRLPGVALFAVTREDPSSLKPLLEFLRTNETVVILGSSGVGKSMHD